MGMHWLRYDEILSSAMWHYFIKGLFVLFIINIAFRSVICELSSLQKLKKIDNGLANIYQNRSEIIYKCLTAGKLLLGGGLKQRVGGIPKCGKYTTTYLHGFF